jgi:glutathione S-transferase
MNLSEIQPIKVYGSDVSYFTGKLENYFKVKGIPYEMISLQAPFDGWKIKREVGVYQIPALELGDGRWMTDSTKIIQWFEAQYPANPLIPQDPVQAFFCFLFEDYADEWLWRPAMHYRWHYPEGAHHQSRHLVDEHMAGIPLPSALKRWVFRMRQRGGYTRGDGITRENVSGVEDVYTRTLRQLQNILETRPFLLGERPSLVDIGFSGPFFRHFALDPIPLEILRQQAPAVLEWVARLWNTRIQDCTGDLMSGIPDDLGPTLDDIGQNYLPYLCANVDAVAQGNNRFSVEIGGVAYKRARYSRYRVWCLQELRSHFTSLPDTSKAEVRELLQKYGCWEPLWRQPKLPLLPGQEKDLPFRASTKMVAAYE